MPRYMTIIYVVALFDFFICLISLNALQHIIIYLFSEDGISYLKANGEINGIKMPPKLTKFWGLIYC